jgi:GT2 family glycosyltransferase
LLDRVGGLRMGFEGSQDYDLVLRLAEATGRIHHIPDVLYHWRQHMDSTALNARSKPYAHDTGKRALTEHLQRRYAERFLRVEDGEHTFTYVPRFAVPAMPASIIIPTRDKAGLLSRCVDSILEKSTWADFEILVLDNYSAEAETAAYFERIQAADPRVRVLPAHFEFNWSRLNNYGVREASGDVLVFLNNDTEVITPDWLDRLMETASLPDVATVGGLLLYDDGTIQHAGVVVGLGGWADHVFKGERVRHLPTPWVSSVVSRDVLAVTGACVAIERAKFEALGGFDETFVVCGSDVELGIRAYKSGLRNVYLPQVRLYHFESKSRGQSVPSEDFVQSDLKYAPYRLGGDPFFNPNLSRQHTSPTVLAP